MDLTHRERLQQLVDRLAAEYTGVVPPGQLMALVFRLHHATSGEPRATPLVRLEACEQSARAMLRARFGRRPMAVSASVAGNEPHRGVT